MIKAGTLLGGFNFLVVLLEERGVSCACAVRHYCIFFFCLLKGGLVGWWLVGWLAVCLLEFCTCKGQG